MTKLELMIRFPIGSRIWWIDQSTSAYQRIIFGKGEVVGYVGFNGQFVLNIRTDNGGINLIPHHIAQHEEYTQSGDPNITSGQSSVGSNGTNNNN